MGCHPLGEGVGQAAILAVRTGLDGADFPEELRGVDAVLPAALDLLEHLELGGVRLD